MVDAMREGGSNPFPKGEPMKWSKAKACKALGIWQGKFVVPEGAPPEGLHGYANRCEFFVNPVTPYPAAAGFHEIAHIVLYHTMTGLEKSPRDKCLQELEVAAVGILCLREVGGSGLEASREYFGQQRELWRRMEGDLPADFKAKVNRAARTILDAGRIEGEQS